MDNLNNSNISFENNKCDFKAKFDKLNTEVTKFNKGQNDLNMILSSSRPLHNKNGLGYNHRNSTRYAFMYNKNVSATTKFRVKSKSNFHRNSKTAMTNNVYNFFRSTKSLTGNMNKNYLSIWVPVNWKNREKCINNYFDMVVNNKNYIYKGTTTPKWVWFPKN